MRPRIPICAVLLVLSSSAAAQTAPLPVPKALALPNYDNVLVGKDPGLEGGAYIARADDAAANVYDAAGLLNAERTSINASANGYIISQVASTAFNTKISGTTIDALPGFFGVLLGEPFIHARNLRFGFAAARTQSWAPPSLDQSALPAGAGALSRLTYSSKSSFRTQLYQLAAAWSPTDSRALRLGLSVGAAQTSLDATTGLSGELALGGGPAQYLCSLRESSDEWDLLAGLSAQWDVTRALTLGAKLVSPGMKLGTGSLVTYEASFLQPATPSSYFFRDENGAFRYKHPFEIGVGVAYRFSAIQLEADVRYHGAESQYEIYRSSAPLQAVVQNPDGTTTSSTENGPMLVYAARQVVNVALGGNWRLTQALKLHAGFYTSMSPVDDAEHSQFRKANLYGLTGGADLQFRSFGFSLGLGYQFGSSSPTRIGLGTGSEQLAETTLTLRAISFIYAFTYQF